MAELVAVKRDPVGNVMILDQSRLPAEEKWLSLSSAEDVGLRAAAAAATAATAAAAAVCQYALRVKLVTCAPACRWPTRSGATRCSAPRPSALPRRTASHVARGSWRTWGLKR
jgi:methylthioribose-1-phosphate isomerase